MITKDDPQPRSRTPRGLAIEIIGWTGTVLLITGFLLNTLEILGPRSLPYLLLNLFGAAGVGANAYVHRTYPAMAIEAMWALIAAVGIGRYVLGG